MRFQKGNKPEKPFTKGHTPWNKGKKLGSNLKSSQKLKGRKAWNKGKVLLWMRGDKHPRWKGGVRKERKIWQNRIEYKKWRSDVFERDNWTCQFCRIRGVYIEAHHIKPWAEFLELRFVTENGVTLCNDCHKLIHKKIRK